MDPIKIVVDAVRSFMTQLAKVLNKVSNGAIKPVHITILSFLGHIPAAWALYSNRAVLAAVLIAVFGLMDALDGALAREQKSASRLGMFFDSVTDRIKEVLIYSALAVYVFQHEPTVQPWVVVALAGSSVLVSYVRARGETAIIQAEGGDKNSINKVFMDGISRYEIRMALLIVGLLSGYLAPLLRLLVAFNLYTAALRFMQAARVIAEQEAKERAEADLKTTKKKAH